MPSVDSILVQIQGFLALYGLRVLAALAIFIIGRIIAGSIRKVMKKAMDKSKVDPTLSGFLTSVVYFGILTFVVIAALGKLGVQTASFIAILGAAGLAVGLALQGSLSNFAAGVLMIIFRPFRVGEYIEGGGTAGTVRDIGIFTTELTTPDNKKVIVPNSKLTGDNIVNYSVTGTRRVDMIFGVSYGDDIDKVKRIIQEVLEAETRILEDPKPLIALSSLGDSSVNFSVRPWVKSGDYWPVLFDLNEAIKKRFDAEKISIPFPQQDVHLYKVEK
ncbi:mechanosensitive ion channel family protein [Desulfobotulus sp.]|jgi:small conductance mechanosensitive channel|uniref:mechanosensitive ion channel family protein n=1 Tax=Desulfobotulus sp. TaxID=1940337 RepID=UPI002A3693DF|nr:mechanosensitive ion channel domain-containing protein [Desulfobotulus sp.]MDY0163803.1 mechanosensitive ion channel [Desulfobotulus sp.]